MLYVYIDLFIIIFGKGPSFIFIFIKNKLLKWFFFKALYLYIQDRKEITCTFEEILQKTSTIIIVTIFFIKMSLFMPDLGKSNLV